MNSVPWTSAPNAPYILELAQRADHRFLVLDEAASAAIEAVFEQADEVRKFFGGHSPQYQKVAVSIQLRLAELFHLGLGQRGAYVTGDGPLGLCIMGSKDGEGGQPAIVGFQWFPDDRDYGEHRKGIAGWWERYP